MNNIKRILSGMCVGLSLALVFNGCTNIAVYALLFALWVEAQPCK